MTSTVRKQVTCRDLVLTLVEVREDNSRNVIDLRPLLRERQGFVTAESVHRPEGPEVA